MLRVGHGKRLFQRALTANASEAPIPTAKPVHPLRRFCQNKPFCEISSSQAVGRSVLATALIATASFNVTLESSDGGDLLKRYLPCYELQKAFCMYDNCGVRPPQK